MTIERIREPLLLSLVALVATACDPRPSPEASSPRDAEVAAADPTAPASSSPEAGPSTATVRGEAAPAVQDWRPWMDGEVERLRATRPDHFNAVMDLPARATRAGFLRISGPIVRDPDSAPLLLHRLLSRNEPAAVRAAIVDALPRTTGDYSAALAELMELETEAQVREMIAASLARAQAPYALEGLARGVVDVDPRVRAEAVRSLGRREDGAQRAPLIIDALTDPDEVVATEAARALGNLRVPSAKEALVGQLSSSSAVLRRHSLRALSRIDMAYTRSLPQLEGLRADEDPKVARVAEKIATEG